MNENPAFEVAKKKRIRKGRMKIKDYDDYEMNQSEALE
jgi:hypothetical protein